MIRSGRHFGSWTNASEREMGRVVADLAYAETAVMLADGLHQHIDDLQQRMNRVGEAVHAQFFAMGPLPPEIRASSFRIAAGSATEATTPDAPWRRASVILETRMPGRRNRCRRHPGYS